MQKSLVWVTVAEERAEACLPCENNTRVVGCHA